MNKLNIIKSSILTLFVLAIFAVCNGQETLSSATERVEFYGNGFSTNTISIGEFNPDRTCSSDASSAFLSAFRSDKEVVFIPKGCYLIAKQIIIPEGKTLVFEKGAMLDVPAQFSGNYTKILAGQNQLFSLNSNITGTWQPHDGAAYVEWFGARGNGTGRNDIAAFQKALEVFCRPNTIRVDDKSARYSGVGTSVKAIGSAYIIEKTLNFPPWGYLEIGKKTIMKIDTTNFFDVAVNITESPYYISGGTWIVPRYDDQTGYSTSLQNDAAKIKYAYNKNPVFRLYLKERMHVIRRWGAVQSRAKNEIKDIEIRQVTGYPRYANYTPNCLYDGFFITSDTSSYSFGTLEWQRTYRIIDYKTGDDFTNIGASSNANGVVFTTNTHPPVDSNPDSLRCIPSNWTNGSVVRNITNAAYFHTINNIILSNADTALYIQGDLKGEGVSGWTFDNWTFDKCATAVVIGRRSWQNLFSNIYLQVRGRASVGSGMPTLDIRGHQNYFAGGLMDMYHDSTIYIHSASGNIVNLSVANNRLLEDYTKITGGYSPFNAVGTHSIWHLSNSNSEQKGAYWFNGRKMGIKDPKNKTVDFDKNPRALLDIVGKPGYTTDPVLILETQSSAYSPNNKIDNLTAFGNALSINQRVAPNQTTVRPGFGSSIRFFVTDENEPNRIYNQYPMGILGFRQDNSQFLKTQGEQAAFQIWQSSDGTWLNTMTIDPQGKMGLLGMYNPKYTLDLSEVGTLRSGNILDDGTDVEIKSPLSINVLHFTPTKRPVKATLGDMYLSSEDGNLYFYTNTGWKAVVLK